MKFDTFEEAAKWIEHNIPSGPLGKRPADQSGADALRWYFTYMDADEILNGGFTPNDLAEIMFDGTIGRPTDEDILERLTEEDIMEPKDWSLEFKKFWGVF